MVRQKNRWLLFEIIYDPDSRGNHVDGLPFQTPSSSSLSQQTLSNILRDVIQLHFGPYGSGCIAGSFALKYFSPLTNTGILRIHRDHARMAWAALSFIRTIDGKSCMLRVVHLSGTIKKCQLAAIQRDRHVILAMQTELNCDQELKTSRDAIMAVDG